MTKPTALKLLAGNPGKRDLTKEPLVGEVVSIKCPPAPDFVGKEGGKKWRELYKQLSHMKVLTDADLTALAMACECWNEYLLLTENVRNLGYMITTTGHRGEDITKPNPAVSAKQHAYVRFHNSLKEFGLTPKSRVGLSTVPEKKDKDEKFGARKK